MSSSIAAIHVAKKQLGFDDDTYRAKLRVITGKTSTKSMTETERQQVLTVLRSEGFKPIERRANGRQKLTGPFAKKLQALWIAGYNLGLIEKNDDAALLAFVKRQTGIDHTRFLHFPDDAAKAIEGLKRWLARDGGVDWSGPAPSKAPGYRIAFAQWTMLCPGGERDFWDVIADMLDLDEAGPDLPSDQWITVMNAFGVRLRASKAT
ncbi:regulatory protein GemA [Rhizobium sp. CFBP 8762]|uniref:regulatory protein GemA n=1 Tax=Rhizobium sp. CFBP 8762 TaxID=2775279 RepID=UPI00177D11A5|nr:regulatory protein GemA [Rhizobium sp. CFBP 8762]MBD8554899.1 regulatory protein GemA [Rhizobium sp. CFBP 8762]